MTVGRGGVGGGGVRGGGGGVAAGGGVGDAVLDGETAGVAAANDAANDPTALGAEVVDTAAIDEFTQTGVVCLRRAFAPRWLRQLAIGIDKNFAAPGPYHSVYTPPGEPGGFYDDYCNWQRIPEYRDFVLNSPAAEIAGRLMRAAAARLYHEHVLIKEPGTREATPWHHDLPYYGLAGEQLCSLWLPLDEVPKSACPQFIAGSHLRGVGGEAGVGDGGGGGNDNGAPILYYPRLFASHTDYSDAPGFHSLPDIDAQRDRHDIRAWQLARGDCVVFHMRTVHGAPPTTEMTHRRRGFSSRWLGDDARFAARPWTTSPPFPGLNLTPGAPLDHPSFPVVWRR